VANSVAPHHITATMWYAAIPEYSRDGQQWPVRIPLKHGWPCVRDDLFRFSPSQCNGFLVQL
jgi:hypothetical protein